MATHRLRHAGSGVARARITNAPVITIEGSGERGVTLSDGQHDITFGIAGQAGTSWSLSVVRDDDDETVVWSKKGKLPKDGLEIGTFEFEA